MAQAREAPKKCPPNSAEYFRLFDVPNRLICLEGAAGYSA
jgi:hypothetical protein